MDRLQFNRGVSLALGIAGLLLSTSAFAITEIKSIGFAVDGGAGKFTVEASGPLKYTRQDYPEEKQIVLDVSNARLLKPASRQLDTSSFDSAVTMISPYQIEDEKDKVRIVIQLRENASASIKDSGNGLLVSIGGSGEPAGEKTASQGGDTATEPAAEAAGDHGTADKKETFLESFEKTAVNKHFTGRPITLQVKDAEIQDVLRLIGEASGFNVIVSSSVTGKITLSLVDVPWDQVLDVVLSTMKLGAERSNNILRVMTLTELTQLKTEQAQAKAAAQQTATRITKVFPISYADLGSLSGLLQTFGRSIALGVASSGQAGVVQTDSRTNSIIVQDLPENVERMKKLIEILDTQTPQVLVEAKIVEAGTSFSKTMSGNLGLGFGPKNGRSALAASFNGAQIPNTTLGGTTAAGTGTQAAQATVTGTQNAFQLTPSVGFLPGVNFLNALLAMSEAEQSAKIISSPRVVVLHRDSASIVQSQPILIESTVISGTSTQTNRTFQNANISLTVTPTVTNDESVLLQLAVTRDSVENAGGGQNATAQRTMTTRVLVDSGSTLVIGGVYTQDQTDSEDGIPFLRKIPLIGAFFTNRTNRGNRRELFIFVTPRILNTKRAGLKTT